MIFDVNDALADGTTAARGKLLSTATQFLDGLNAAQSADVSLKRDTAEAFERLGDIAGNASQSNLGNAQAAESHYRKALLLREQLIALQPESFADTTGMVKIHQRLARMALDRGDPVAAKALGEAQARWAERAAAQKPEDINAQLAVGEANISLALVHYYPGRRSLGDYAGALRQIEQAIERRSALYAKAPKDANVVRGFVQPLVMLTQMQLVHGQAAQALQTVNRIGPLIDPIMAEASMRTRLAPLKISELRHRGEAQIDVGDRDLGLRSLTQAVALADEMAAADPRNVFLERRAATTRSSLAYHQLRAGEIEPALANSRAYLAVMTRQLGAQPESANLRLFRYDAMTALVEALIASGRVDEAKALALEQQAIDQAQTKSATPQAHAKAEDSSHLLSVTQALHWQAMALHAANPKDESASVLIAQAAERIDRTLASDAFDANMQRILAEQRVQAADVLVGFASADVCALIAKANEGFAALKSDGRLSANFARVSARASVRAAECAAQR